MTKTVHLREIEKTSDAAAAIEVELQGFTVGAKIEITIWEDDTVDSLIADAKAKTKQKVGRISGEVVQISPTSTRPPLLSLKGVKAEKDADSKLKLVVLFAQPSGKAENVELRLPNTTSDVFEGEAWELFATVENEADVVSPTTRVAHVRRALSVDRREATYRHYADHQIDFYHDGSTDAAGTAGYFKDLVDAIDEAKDFIFIADWSFQPHMRPVRGAAYTLDSTLGAMLIKQAHANPSMVIAIHTWDHTNVAAADTQNDNGNTELDTIAKELKLPGLSGRPKNLLWQATSRTGKGYSHHQKFVVMDSDLDGDSTRRRLRAFVGGLDITRGRFDWGEHLILPDAATAGFLESLSYAKQGPFDDWYNNEFWNAEVDTVPAANLTTVFRDKDWPKGTPNLPRQPWHDIALRIAGPACWDLVREFVGRWRHQPSIGGNMGDTGAAPMKTVTDKYLDTLQRLKDKSKAHDPGLNPLVYAQQWHPGAGHWAAQVLRSLPRVHWADDKPILSVTAADHTSKPFEWTLTGDTEASILTAYMRAIGQAEEFVYIETQFFISSGGLWARAGVANNVAQALADRAIDRARNGKPFHIYLVLPMYPEGSPGDSGNAAQRQFQWSSIRAMATRIEAATRKPHGEFLSVFFLAKWHELSRPPIVTGTREDNLRANKRYQIYVHSKFMLIDDRYMIIGSANLNERSLAGNRDSEIALHVWPSDDAKLGACLKEAREFRALIWAEHLGPKFSAAACAAPASAPCVALVRGAAAENYKAFREGTNDPAVHGHLCLWPLDFTSPATASPMRTITRAPEADTMIPDRPNGLTGEDLDAWRWHAPGRWWKPPFELTAQGNDLAE